MDKLDKHTLISQYIEHNHFGRLVGMTFEIEQPGTVTYSLTIGEDHLATPRAAHGGVLSALLDATLGVGALSLVCEAFDVVSTVNMQVTFLEAALLGDILTSRSKVIRSGKRLIFMEAIIENQAGLIVAQANGVFNRYPAVKAGYSCL
jgi:uncharacterized protein (TIGR00369 family)